MFLRDFPLVSFRGAVHHFPEEKNGERQIRSRRGKEPPSRRPASVQICGCCPAQRPESCRTRLRINSLDFDEVGKHRFLMVLWPRVLQSVQIHLPDRNVALSEHCGRCFDSNGSQNAKARPSLRVSSNKQQCLLGVPHGESQERPGNMASILNTIASPRATCQQQRSGTEGYK